MTSGLLQARLAAVEERLRLLYVERTAEPAAMGSAADALSDAGLRADDAVRPDAGEYSDADRLAHLAREFGLGPVETDLLVAAVLSELSTVCGSAYRMLNGSSHSSRPTVTVALEILGISTAEGLVRGLLNDRSPLLAAGLVEYENPEAPYPDRHLRVADRVLNFLVSGVEETDGACGHYLHVLRDGAGSGDPETVAEIIDRLRDNMSGSLYLREGATGEALSVTCAALTKLGRTPILVDPEELADAPQDLLVNVVREARLRKAGVIVPMFTDPSAEAAGPLRILVRGLGRAPVPLLLYGSGEWDADAWRTTPDALLDVRGNASAGEQLSPTSAPVVDRARREAAQRARTISGTEARRIARSCAVRDLERLARHIQPRVARDDLVLPRMVRERLDMLVFRIRYREQVLGGWDLRRGGGRGWGATALFAGESGTGKTMAAEVVSAELGVDLYIVSLPSVVSKYIGETEKNLERIFSAAESLSGVIVFDEADSMFSKRGAVRDSNDRYANMQSSYLLQRLESFNGLAILTTNLRSNMDSAFTRRFDEVIEFESPGADVRAQLWRKFLGKAPVDDCDIDRLASGFNLAGGSIRAGVETAAFAAAARGREVTTPDLLAGIELEYRKLGRLFDRGSDLGGGQ
ncbi:ATP-binding protein [Streptomyces sp. H27-D2]|uniref:ATP-binding protein n=1 Tax=Streptomyces sp. H27-D2 TaxID=3046304 RepID=UPI002DBCCAF0|nr:ATP-binding protein [Streptomyces sp. H27-D2]MEC4017984.1 ATP-binding protein [Streptomyces sp. H27-D2]